MEAIGVITEIGKEHQVSDKFKKRDFVIEVDPQSQYPQEIQFQLSQTKTGLIDGYAIGNEIKVQFNLQGRRWQNAQGETKFFNTLNAWKIEGKKAYNAATQKTETASSSAPADDLPF